MDFNIPAYTYPCLAPSFYSNTPQLIFLFGVPDGTPTLVSHLIDISNIDAPKVSYITSDSKADRQYKWDPKAEKSCFTNPMSFTSGGYANTEVQQLGTTTVAAILSASFGLQQVFDLSMVKFKTSKLFASTRVQGRDDYAVAWAAFTVADAVGGAPAEKEGWVGVFRNTSNIIVTDQGQTNLPPSPTLAVGAYSTTNANGDLAVYDKDGAGYLYRASSVSHPPGANAPVAWLYSGQKQPIDSGGAALTSEAIPISAQNIAFILDQTPDNLTVVYSLRPDSSPKLVKVATKGNLPPFIKNMAGTVLDEYSGISEKIVIYSLDQTTGAARLNLFDTVTGIWTGSGLVDPSSEPATASPLLPPRKIITLGQAADNASDISAGRNETGAGSNEPSAPAAISNDINNNQLPVFWVVSIGSVVVALFLLSAVVAFVAFRQRRRVGTSTFIMSSPLPPISKHDLPSSANPILARNRIKVLYPEAQPPVQSVNHQIIGSNNGGHSHNVCHCAHGDQRSASSPLKSTITSAAMATTEAKVTKATAPATTSDMDSDKCTQPTVPIIFRPQPSQLDLSTISLTSNHSNLSTPNTPPSLTLTTPDQLYFDSFRHLQHGRNGAMKRQTGSSLTTEEVVSSPILPPNRVPVSPSFVTTATTISSRSQRPALTYNSSATSLARGPHTVMADGPAVQLAPKRRLASQSTTIVTTITPSNAHICDPSSACPS